MAAGTGILANIGMAKRQRGRPPGRRGPYSTDVKNPDQLGAGGIRLRQHRLARAWTVEKLASEAGLSQGTISGIENGGGYSPDTLEKLAKALKTTVGALFAIDPREGKGEDFWPLWEAADALDQQRIIDYAKGVIGGRKK